MNRRPAVLVFTLAALALAAVTRAATFYVSPAGDDRNPGTEAQPLATLAGARDHLRASGRLGREPVTVLFAAGTYYLADTVGFGPEDSGTATAPVAYEAEPGVAVVLSGGVRLNLHWTAGDGGVWSAPVPAGTDIDELFVNGELQHLARYPNYDPAVAVFGGFAADAISPARTARWSDPAGGYVHAMHKQLWGDYHYRITGRNADGTIAYEGGWQNNRQMGMHPQYRFVENIREELDAPGEWFLDRRAGLLLFMPPRGLDLGTAVVEGARLRGLIDVRGSAERPVRSLAFSGFIFRHTRRTFMETREPLLRSDWCIYRGGAVRFEEADDCVLEHCEFDRVGGNAVFVSNYNRRIAVRDCWIHDGGASGVCFVGSPQAVRNPLFEYGQHLEYAALDDRPGPQSDDYPAECRVEDCLIRAIGRVEKQVAGVEISMARRITVSHCTICEVPRAGINIGDGTWGGHLIDGCDVFDTVLETGDHGSFNSWGRDRYWKLQGAPAGALGSIALLDAIEPNVIRRSRWRCDRGWDIDLDDGSSNYEIYENLMLGGGLKLREGFRRHAWNNVIVNNSLHPHVWFADSGDTFTHNIVMGAYRPAVMKIATWGSELDHNLFTTSDADRTAFADKGADAHSAVGDPRFVDAATGDFRVRDGSPALAVGFHNFPMDQFGVRDPKLRAKAGAPRIPPLRTAVLARGTASFHWLGAEIRELEGQEYSVFGVAADSGGILITDAPGQSKATTGGLRTGDVIEAVGGTPTRTIADLVRVIRVQPEQGMVPVTVRRDQKDATVKLPGRPAEPSR